MKYILLTQNRKTLIDDEDFEWLNQYKWSVNSSNYPSRYGYINGKRVFITIHRFIMNPPVRMQVDHINGNRFDNRKENLRICTRSQNCTNRKSWKPNISGYRGVTFHKTTKKWRATIKIKQQKITLGLFFNKEQAALAYNQAAIAYFGEYAVLNNIPSSFSENT